MRHISSGAKTALALLVTAPLPTRDLPINADVRAELEALGLVQKTRRQDPRVAIGIDAPIEFLAITETGRVAIVDATLAAVRGWYGEAQHA
jgi:hypothetical protein